MKLLGILVVDAAYVIRPGSTLPECDCQSLQQVSRGAHERPFKRYSQAKSTMMREALAKLGRNANEYQEHSATADVRGHFWHIFDTLLAHLACREVL